MHTWNGISIYLLREWDVVTSLRITLVAVVLSATCMPVREARAQDFPSGPRVTITAVTQPGPTFPQYSRVDVPLLRDGLARRTRDRVQVKLATWPEMNLGGPEIVRAVRSGQIDIGAVSLSVVSGDVPLLDGFDLAGLHPTIEQARRAADAMRGPANRELERVGVQIAAIYPLSGQALFCRQPLASPAELRGRKVRTFGPSLNDFMLALGAQPVSIAFPEVYGALERGVVDCAITGTGTGNNVKWYEVAPSLYTLPLGWGLSAYFVNTNWWSRLDPPIREVLTVTLREVEEQQWRLGAELTEDGIACNTGRAEGCRIHTLAGSRRMIETRASAEDVATLRRLVAETVLPGWVRRCGPRCGETYNEVVAPVTSIPVPR